MKKAFDQTIRDLKREVNKKVLKVPSIEQKVLDATSNEPWGPHGSLLADIAMATRNYHEYQMIMTVIWKRLNDTGKNWRHVYKALTVLEYLVAHGSERVIDEIREHAHQISTLSDFQYIDSSGRDQGNNVRRKSQSLVLLVNDKERIHEVRQKAAANRDKFRSTSGVGGMYRPGPGGYGDDRYAGPGGYGDERNGYGREREWGYRDDERYGQYGDSYSREGDRYGRDSDEYNGREYRDDDFRGRSQSVDDNQNGPRSRSVDRDGGHAYDDDDDRHSPRASSVRPDDHSRDGRPLECKFSEPNLTAPPSYEEAVGDSRSPTNCARGGEIPAASVPQSSPVATTTAVSQAALPVANVAPQASTPAANAAPQSSAPGVHPSQVTFEHGATSHLNMEADGFDEFDPRGSVSAAPSTSNIAELDLFGSLSDVFSPNPLAIMPAQPVTGDSEADSTKAASNVTFAAVTTSGNSVISQFEDSFGDSPFKAIPSDDSPAQHPNFTSMSSFQLPVNTVEYANPAFKVDTTANPEITRAFSGVSFHPNNIPNTQAVANPQYPSQEAQSHDILAGILPPSGPLPASEASFPATNVPPDATGLPTAVGAQTSFLPSNSQPFAAGFMPQSVPTSAPFLQMGSQNMAPPSTQLSHQNSLPYTSQPTVFNSNATIQTQTGSLSNQNSGSFGDLLPQAGSTNLSSQYASSNAAGPLTLVPQQPSKEKEKFETKSAVWADTLSKGLVDLNISGPKCNPMADIGIDFETLNRKEKRMEKPSAAPTISNISMGKAMGSGSGLGRAGAGAIRTPPNPTAASAMSMGMGMGMGIGSMGAGPGMGMGSYGSMNQPPMGMGVGGMGMNMGMGQGMQMQPSNGFGNMSNYNPMMGRGGYSQQPYGGGYR